jgi:uncharacterized RDD family membrane protein YckC
LENFDTSFLNQDSFHGAGSQSTIEYAGFWRRFWAFIIDSIILYVLTSALVYAIGQLWGTTISQEMLTELARQQDPQAILNLMVGPMLDLIFFTSLGTFFIFWFYFAGFESSKMQATPGKSILGIIVTDMDEDRISFGTATGRALGKYISALILYIGYLMVAFTKQKQGLHDKIAGTLVIRKPRY